MGRKIWAVVDVVDGSAARVSLYPDAKTARAIVRDLARLANYEKITQSHYAAPDKPEAYFVCCREVE